MKIPYVVSLNTRQAYSTWSTMKSSPGEAPRKIVAEDFEWDDDFTPAPLTFYAALALSRVFHRINPLHKILQKDVDMLMDLYPSDIPLKFSVTFIKDEQYWKRSFYSKFPSRKEMGVSYWKGKFLSACLQDYLENINPDVFIEEDGVTLAKLVSPYIYELGLNQLQMVRQPTPSIPYENLVEDTCEFSVPKVYDHIPLEPVLAKLYNLVEISLIFGKNHLEDNYLTRYFEFSLADCESLCKGLQHLNHLTTFRINRSNLDCSKVKIILQNLVKKDTIEELDFNHCKIGDYGMKALGGFILLHKNVKRVRIANNRFKEVGVQGIAYALQMNPAAPIELIEQVLTLQNIDRFWSNHNQSQPRTVFLTAPKLSTIRNFKTPTRVLIISQQALCTDFSLNPMSLECATIFAAAFVRCKEKPQTLIVNSCGFRGASAEKMAGLLCLNRGLTRLDMAANNLSGEAEKTLIRALEQNKKILRLDLRSTHISEETQVKVNELLERNKKLIGQETESSEEIPPLYLNEPEYMIWEFNPNNPDYIPGRYPERVPEV